MSFFAIALSYLLPGALFLHACWRTMSAGKMNLKRLALGPAVAFVLALTWFGQSSWTQFVGETSDAWLRAQLYVGPLLYCALTAMMELPFFTYWLVHRSKTSTKPVRKARGA